MQTFWLSTFPLGLCFTLFTMLVLWLFCFCLFQARSVPGSFDSFSSWKDLRNALLRWNDTDSKLQLISRYGQLNAWNISAIRNLSGLFQDLEEFDEDIGAWDTSGVMDMSFMFAGAKSFNRPIGSWNVSSVTNMRGMFGNAAHFNQPIGSWDVAAVRDMSYMFYGAKSFNRPIETWNVSSVANMSCLF